MFCIIPCASSLFSRYPSNDAAWLLVPVLIFVPLIIFLMARRQGKARKMLEAWAAANGYRLLEAEFRSVRTGPFFFRRSNSQAVYRIAVSDDNGKTRQGWVRLGGWFVGLMSDQVNVVWDDGGTTDGMV